MALDHRFVFAENLYLRCKCVKDEYFPLEILDFEEIITRVKRMFVERLEVRRNSAPSPKRELSLKDRLFLFDSGKQQDEEISAGENIKLKQHPGITEANTDSVVLQVSPLMRHRRKHNKDRYSTGRIHKNLKNLIETNIDDLRDSNISYPKMKNEKRRKDIIDCLNESSPDFVHVASFSDVPSAEDFLRDLRDSSEIKTVAVDIDVGRDLSISISYQRLMDFKQDFMMVDFKKTDFMLFLKPF